MNANIKQLAKIFALSCIERSSRSSFGDFFLSNVIKILIERTETITHNNLKLKIAIPNLLCKWRAQTLSTKEPETLEWIDDFPNYAILWDIGANIGLYSLYAAKKRIVKCGLLSRPFLI